MDQTADEARFQGLFELHHKAVTAYFMRRIPDESDALNATEEVFLVAWRRIGDVPDSEAELPWLYGVARRILSNHRRGRSRFSRLRRRLAAEPPHLAADPAALAIRSVEEEEMLKALATLSDRDREVLYLTFWEQLPHQDIGRIVGCRTEAVHVRRYRAVQHLRRALDRDAHAGTQMPVNLRLEGRNHVE